MATRIHASDDDVAPRLPRGPRIPIAHLSEHGTDRFTCVWDGRQGTCTYIGAGCALVRWDSEAQVEHFTVRKLDKKSGEEVDVEVEFRRHEKAGPVTLALEVIPMTQEAM